ncbi:MAG: hypothetical protein WC546_03315 [Candidatus Omnitrophota bacterium]|jgi:hypothetical protein
MMKIISYVLTIASLVSLLLAIALRFYEPRLWVIMGISMKGYLTATALLLLFSTNIALIELLKKK